MPQVIPNILVTVVGGDRPGVVRAVSSILHDFGCAMAELSQTTLLGQFAGIFSAAAPASLALDKLAAELNGALRETGLFAWITPIKGEAPATQDEGEPYVLSIGGPDSPSLIPAVTGTIASFNANIDNLRAISLSGGAEPPMAAPLIIALEISVPRSVSQKAFRQALAQTAESLGVEISLQHRDIFEAINRV
ncbi:MAG: hypothetical protein LBO66_10920 [Deltaproteobacteria bacterium]|jgi:glycine cleavage system transcriptional repressor|nr:hypothetical protein [Deltaproteobacteria bacterium]